MLKGADRIVAMDSDVLTQIPAEYLSKTENWGIGMLVGKRKEEVAQIREEIRNRVDRLFRELGSDATTLRNV